MYTDCITCNCTGRMGHSLGNYCITYATWLRHSCLLAYPHYSEPSPAENDASEQVEMRQAGNGQGGAELHLREGVKSNEDRLDL